MKGYLKIAGIALAAYAVAAMVNRSVNIPVIGTYLPK
jgi:hypothetical protein